MNFTLKDKEEEKQTNKRNYDSAILESLNPLEEEKPKKATIIPCAEDTWQVSKKMKKTDKELAESLLESISNGKKPTFLESETKILKNGIKDAAPDQDTPTYETEGYGKALLLGMGYQEGVPYGRSSKVVEPLLLKSIPKLSGLGSQPKLLSEEQSREEVQNSLEKYLIKRNVTEISPNCMISIISGPFEGLFGRVLSVFNDKYQTRLNDLRTLRINSEDAVLLNISKLNVEHPARKFARAEVLEEEQVKKETILEPIVMEKKTKIEWIRPFLKVRIVSKSLKEGKYYKKKAMVIDIPDIYHCTLKLIDDNQIIENVYETMLETIIPSKGQDAIVVKGKYKGHRGTVIEKSNSKEQCVIQFDDNEEIQKIHYDDVCSISKEEF
jgi:ribosomal protein L24